MCVYVLYAYVLGRIKANGVGQAKIEREYSIKGFRLCYTLRAFSSFV